MHSASEEDRSVAMPIRIADGSFVHVLRSTHACIPTGVAGTSAEEAPFLSDNENAMTKTIDHMSIKPA